MRQLESIPSSAVTLGDLSKALANIQTENGIGMTSAQINSLAKKIFN